MRSFLSRWLRPKKAFKLAHFNLGRQFDADAKNFDIFGSPVPDAEYQFYPPKVSGVSVFAPESIASHYGEEIARLAKDAKIGAHRQDGEGRNLFEARYLDVIFRFIEYAHMLPASENQHHSQLGGLFRHSLEVAYLAMRQADEYRPPDTGMIDKDDARRDRYIFAAWIAGLLHDAGKLFTDMRVTAITMVDTSTNTERTAGSTFEDAPVWSPYVESLVCWAKRLGVKRYGVQFIKGRRHKEHDQYSTILLSAILKGESLRYITSSPDDLYGNLNLTLSGYTTSNNYLARIVRDADSHSTGKDVQKIIESTLGEREKSIAKLVIDQARTARATWTFNKPNGHAWIIGGEVYLRWTSAFNSIAGEAIKNHVERIPRKARTLLTVMEDYRLVEPLLKSSMSVHFTPGRFQVDDVIKLASGDECSTWEELVKVTSPSFIFGGDPIPSNAEGVIRIDLENGKQEFAIATTDGDIEFLDPSQLLDAKSQQQTEIANDSTSANQTAASHLTQDTHHDLTEPTPTNELNTVPESKKGATESSSQKEDVKKSHSEPKNAKSKSKLKIDFMNVSKTSSSTSADTPESTKATTSLPNQTKPIKQKQNKSVKAKTKSAASESESDINTEISQLLHQIAASNALIKIDARGVTTINGDIAAAHCELDIVQLAEQLQKLGVLKRNYASKSLFDIELVDDVEIRALRLKASFPLAKKEPLSTSISKAKPDRNKGQKDKRKIPKKAVTASQSVDGSVEDNGFRLIGHRATHGTLANLLYELSVHHGADDLVEQDGKYIKFKLVRVAQLIESAAPTGYTNVTQKSINSDLLDYAEAHNCESDITREDLGVLDGWLISLPLTILADMELSNVIK